ncbi:head maturation protease, ClpP-related [Paenibacillus sp. DCT19]|uniref:head maturation protease, ClpP-related n=1 Tax=Paenibacillus sp. DCT19 TaxID=2211212 RepID=UPI00157FAF5F|nr:head maturation protease, ClpP-related [Paenibacillus sp. DCT19]
MKFWSFRNENGKSKLYLYGVIDSLEWWGDEVTPNRFKADLDSLGDISELEVYINSDGGDVFAGQAIHSMLKRHKAKVTVFVDGLAASIASVIAMAGDVVVMPRNSMLMIHNPWTSLSGNSADFRKTADDLDNIRESLIAAYQDKSGMDRDELLSLLEAETWLTAEEAVNFGFADQIEQFKEIAASVNGKKLTVNGQEMDLSKFKNPPKVIVASGNHVSTHRNTAQTKSLSFYERVLNHNKNREVK